MVSVRDSPFEVFWVEFSYLGSIIASFSWSFSTLTLGSITSSDWLICLLLFKLDVFDIFLLLILWLISELEANNSSDLTEALLNLEEFIHVSELQLVILLGELSCVHEAF